MQWGQIKTLFIICFLILNIFLVKQLIDRQQDEITFIPITSREDELKFNINGLDNISDETYTAPLIHTQNYNYNLRAKEEIEALSGQKAVVVDNYYLFSRFNEPVDFDFDDSESELRDYVLNGDRYTYWGELESANVLVFFQEMEHPVFYNANAILLIHLNSEGHMTQYAQTQLRIVGSPEDGRSLIKQYDAIYRLYHHFKEILTGDTITQASLGYHNLVSLPNGEMILNPTWDIQVNNNDHHFINAIDGHNYPQNDQFYQEKITDLITLVESDDDSFVYYHTEDEPDNLLLNIRQVLLAVHQNIVEVDVE